jgi:protein-S-isoprenylcysteine O-methyltransferase Ste14
LSPPKYNRALGVVRLVAVNALIVALVILAEPTPLGVTVGFLFAAVGETLRLWAAGHLLKTRELVTSGPYRYTRNPLYLGRLLIFTGLCIMARLPYGASWIVLACGCVIFFGYYLPRRERVEPARLREAHGESYERYFRSVPALLPARHPYPESTATGWSSDRMLRNREHWMLIAVIALTLILLRKAY